MSELCWNQWKYQVTNLASVICRRNINYQETKRKYVFSTEFFFFPKCFTNEHRVPFEINIPKYQIYIYYGWVNHVNELVMNYASMLSGCRLLT